MTIAYDLPRRVFRLPASLPFHLRGLSDAEQVEVLQVLLAALGYPGAIVRARGYDIVEDAWLLSVLHQTFPPLPSGQSAAVEWLELSAAALAAIRERVAALKMARGEDLPSCAQG